MASALSGSAARGFCDLNVPCDGADGEDLRRRLRRAFRLGYETVAVNVCVHQKDLVTKAKLQKSAKKKAKASEEDEDGRERLLDFPEPSIVNIDKSDYPDLVSKGRKPTVLSRLTIVFSDNSFLPKFNTSKTVKKYDLLALCPANAQALQNLLKSSFCADIITFNHELSGDMKWTRTLYTECVQKNMFFELCYAPMIRDATARRRTITQGHVYHAVGKSRHVVLSGEAASAIELRGPLDVANLGYLLGLNENECKLAVCKMPLEVVRAACGRRIGPYRATVQKIEDLSEEDRWKVPTQSQYNGHEKDFGCGERVKRLRNTWKYKFYNTFRFCS
jgi:ribonuclease P/MRP protein subunit RPP1